MIVNRLQELPRPPKDRPRRYVPKIFSPEQWSDIEPLFTELELRRLNSSRDLESWLLDWSELQAVIGEESSRRYIAMTCDTNDPEIEKRYLFFVENIQPRIKPYTDKLNRRLVDSPHVSELNPHRYSVLIRSAKNSVSIFREENIPIETELEMLAQQYQKIVGSMTVQFDGEERTLPQMDLYLEESDRSLRQAAWETVVNRRLEDAEKLEHLFDHMVKLRHQVALNAGFENYRDYLFRLYERFDYTPDDCFHFHDAIEKHVVPITRAALEDRRRTMKLESVRPWDTDCDALGRPALRPFENTERLVSGCLDMFVCIDGQLGKWFGHMVDLGLLDLDSRKGKGPGGYQQDLPESGVPFIFANTVGVNDDVFTLLHEGGHAFHCFSVQSEPLIPYRHAPMEFSEVASMSMELLGLPYLNRFYDEADSARTAHGELIRKAALWPWCATVDAFQHWIYTHPKHTRDERAEFWKSLMNRFGSGVDYSGYEKALRYRWHAQLHIFEVPLYYIEYAIAQLGAFQVWSQSKKNAKQAVDKYKQGLSLGGSRPLPELFQTAGIRFDFSSKTIEPLMEELRSEIDRYASVIV